MIAVDSSVVVAGFATWHEAHERSRAALARQPRLPAHALLESYSVLTRLPPPHRAPAGLVAEFLAGQFPQPLLLLSERGHRELVALVARSAIAGGATYDALVAFAAREAGASLLTRDRRAATTYEAVGVEFEILD